MIDLFQKTKFEYTGHSEGHVGTTQPTCNYHSNIYIACVTNMGFEFYTRPQQDIVLHQTTTRPIPILIGGEFQQPV